MQTISREIHSLCQRYQALAIHENEQQITIALNGEPSASLLQALRFATGKNVQIEQWPLARLEQEQSKTTQKTQPENAAITAHQQPALDDDNEAPVVQFLNQTLRIAVQRRASDIHFEPYQHLLRIRIRIDGVLHTLRSPSPSLTAHIIARLKILGQLDIAERRLPQDGQLTLYLNDTLFSMRISTLPTQYGEKVVLRILPTEHQDLPLEKLGMNTLMLNSYHQALSLPQGMILVTGPTGSGKTVTLYSGLRQLNDEKRNLCSVEDPIEIPVFGINQTQINIKADLDFACVLRALLRQDPDVIMIGEIRDKETAEIAVKAAQTGHLVLSTLHTNSTSETLIRLEQMGIPAYLLASCVKLVIAQRLVRCLCPHCRQQQDSIHIAKKFWPEPITPWVATGCAHCFSGYYGRTGIYELLNITPLIQNALLHSLSATQLAKLAQQQGQQSLLQAGLTLVEQGITSLEEIYRVVGLPQEEPTNV